MRLGGRPLVLAATAAASIAVTSRDARADAQVSSSAQFGVTAVGEGRLWTRTRFDLGARVEDVYLRKGPRDFGIGPYVEARTAAFIHADYGGGLIAVIPVDATFPVWLGGGAFARRESHEWGGGGNAFIGFGSRSFNYESAYGMAFGVLFDVRIHRGPAPGVDATLAVSIDLEIFAIPWIYLVSAIRS